MNLRILLAGLLAGSCAAPQPEEPTRPPVELAGRSGGTTGRCVPIDQSEALRVSDTNRHVLVYGSGRTVWANQLGPSCGFGRDDVLVTEPIGSYHCRGDIIRSFDRYSHIPGPSCILGDWVPYSRS